MLANYRGFTVWQMCYFFQSIAIGHSWIYVKQRRPRLFLYVFLLLCEVNIEVVELRFLPQVGESSRTDVPSIKSWKKKNSAKYNENNYVWRFIYLSIVQRKKNLANRMRITTYECLHKFKQYKARHYGTRIIFLKASSAFLYPDPSYQNKCSFPLICLKKTINVAPRDFPRPLYLKCCTRNILTVCLQRDSHAVHNIK